MGRRARLLAAVALTLPVLVVQVAPARACTCEGPTTSAGIIRDADAALIGEVIADRGAADGTVQQVRVNEVYVGALPPRIDVFARIGSGIVDPCAVLFSSGDPVAMVLSRDDLGRWEQDACAMLSVAELRRVGGAPRPPDPAAAASSAATPSAVPPTVPDVAAPGPAPPMPWWQIVALGALGSVLTIGGWLAWGRRRARRELAELPHDVSPPGAPA